VRKALSPGRLLLAGAILLLATFAILWLAPSGDYLVLPDKAHPVAPLVTVEKRKTGGGSDGIYFVDVIERKATLLESIFPGIRHGSTLVPGSSVNPEGVSDAARRQADLSQMARSQEIAAAVALRKLGYAVEVQQNGAFVVGVFNGLPAVGKLAPGDVIVAVNGKPVRSTRDLRRLIAPVKPGTPLSLRVRQGKSTRTLRLHTAANPDHPGLSVIGVLVEPAARIHLPFKVAIDAGNIGGPSAGLAFALDLMEKLGRDVDHGHRIAATGELSLDGTVSRIGGIKQKTLGVHEAGIKLFLVPAGNAAEARRYADGVRIIPVRSFAQALRALATLPRQTQPG
jgi:PDZ domain-containing protein